MTTVTTDDCERCPNCGAECQRDSVDVGVGIMYGPWGCPCGWSESAEYNQFINANRALTPDGYRKDQWGGLVPPGGTPRPLRARKNR